MLAARKKPIFVSDTFCPTKEEVPSRLAGRLSPRPRVLAGAASRNFDSEWRDPSADPILVADLRVIPEEYAEHPAAR